MNKNNSKNTDLPSILIVDDHRMLAESIGLSLEEEGFGEISIANSSEEAIAMITEDHPDIIISDVSMPEQDGFNLARQVKRYWPNIKILFLTMHGSTDYIYDAMSSGAQGYVNKTASIKSLVRTISLIADGESVFPAECLQNYHSENRGKNTNSLHLTGREQEILAQLGEGLSNKEIARMLDMAEGTVKVHVKTVLKKLGAKNRTQAAIYAHEQGYNSLLAISSK